MRALVTGGAGFIGSTLVDRLLADGHQVVVVDNFCTGIAANLEHAYNCNRSRPRAFTSVDSDIQAPELVDIVSGVNPHVIFHLAAQVDLDVSVCNPQFDARSNVLGTINLCEAARQGGVRRIVYAASGTARYGAQAGTVDESDRIEPLSPHAVGKLAGELYLRAYAEMYGLAPMCLALADVYGPRQNPHGATGAIAALGSALITGRPHWVYRDSSDARDLVYVEDVVDAFVRAGCAPLRKTGTFHIGTGQCTTMTDVYNLMSAVLDGAPVPSADEVRGVDLNAITLDTTKAANELHWKPAVGLVEGIRRTMNWLCDILEAEPSALLGA